MTTTESTIETTLPSDVVKAFRTTLKQAAGKVAEQAADTLTEEDALVRAAAEKLVDQLSDEHAKYVACDLLFLKLLMEFGYEGLLDETDDSTYRAFGVAVKAIWDAIVAQGNAREALLLLVTDELDHVVTFGH